MAEGGQSSTGSLLHNVLTTHPSHAAALESAKDASSNIFDYLNTHLESMRKAENAPTITYLARHLFFYGDKHGNRSPIADANMRGAIVGLSMDSSIDDLALQYFAAMEFIAQQTRHIIEALNNSGHNISSIFMSGGQCKNKLLMQLMADATGYPVLIPKYIDAAVVLGAAMLGAKAASVNEKGETDSLWTIMDKMSQPGTIIEPTANGKEKILLNAKYQVNSTIFFYGSGSSNDWPRSSLKWRKHNKCTENRSTKLSVIGRFELEWSFLDSVALALVQESLILNINQNFYKLPTKPSGLLSPGHSSIE